MRENVCRLVESASLLLRQVLAGQIYLDKLNDLESTKKIIEEVETTLDKADGVTPVHGRFYLLASQYYRYSSGRSVNVTTHCPVIAFNSCVKCAKIRFRVLHENKTFYN